jgi:hypothetical protein
MTFDRIVHFWTVRRRFCITLPKNHFNEHHLTEHHLTERQFVRNTIWPNTVWLNAIWPKVHLTKSPFNRTPFDRKFFLPKGLMTDLFFKKWSFHRIYYRQKIIWSKKNCAEGRLTESFFWKWSKFIWLKAFSSNGHLTERSFLPFVNFFSVQWPFFEKYKNIRSNELSVKWSFGQMTIFRKKTSVKWTFSHFITIFRKKLSVNFRSNVISFIWLVFQFCFRPNDFFR